MLVQLSYLYMTTRKTIALTVWTFVSKVTSLLFNTLSSFVIAFFPRGKCLNFMAAVIVHSDFEAQENKSLSLFPLFPHLFAMKWWNQMPWSYFFECWILSQLFHSPLSLSSRGDNIQPWCTHFPILNQSVVACLILTVASWPAYRFLRRQVRGSGIPISFKSFP